MERLTFEGNFCDIAMCSEVPGGSFCENGACSQRKVWERLKHYEDLEEQGRLITLPCKVGDKLYFVDGDEAGDFIDEYEVKYFYSSARGVNRIYATCGTLAKNFRPKYIGKTVFLTREAAEEALRGGKKDG